MAEAKVPRNSKIEFSQDKCLLIQDPILKKEQGMARFESFLALHHEHSTRCDKKNPRIWKKESWTIVIVLIITLLA